ncbi:hypothetical protein QJS83_08060 [Bdellovibrio sp. 22V]|uniref:hypothetical protein n=1 Tax=Bdellovibrio TaxID=958 RepID=UPI00254287F4|nr:hypothetical protein [Bdellovibrio sp. 22V]WII73830.1 hypothetical protein QJS83_08060 [Bdellovibrio sp. 22V]
MMSALRNSVILVLSACCFFFATNAHAQDRNAERIRILESRVYQLEGALSQINQRLTNLEYGQRPPPFPEPGRTEVACMITDSGYSKVFLGKGRVKLEAEAAARESCGKAVHPSYCQGSIKCSDKEPLVRGAICVITDTGYSKTFKAEGITILEAEYKARKACGDQVHPSYCTGAIRCDSF